LKAFGFQGFSLAIGSKPSTYKIVRADGSPAKDTLSDGEKTFVTFLYFFHLLKGNQTATDVSVDRVVVFDDPVSSLDSDVLHIVSCLIKSLLNDVRDNKMKIKQVFIFTHNTYFHKETSFFWEQGPSEGCVHLLGYTKERQSVNHYRARKEPGKDAL
jgi:wobble nucleotide-excising tRNase